MSLDTSKQPLNVNSILTAARKRLDSLTGTDDFVTPDTTPTRTDDFVTLDTILTSTDDSVTLGATFLAPMILFWILFLAPMTLKLYLLLLLAPMTL